MASGELTVVEGASAPLVGVPAARAAELASYPATATIADLPGRDLTQAELEALAAGIAQQPEAWAHHVTFDGEGRVYVSLHRDTHVDVWLLCWTPESDTGWHDHDVSSGAVAVVAGELVENNLTLAQGPARPASEPDASSPSGRTTSTGSTVPCTDRSACTPTAPRYGGWVSTPSTTPVCCVGFRSPTRRAAPDRLGAARGAHPSAKRSPGISGADPLASCHAR